MITMENYEGWLMRYADSELDAEERKAVEAFLVEHLSLRQEMEEVAGVRVIPPVAVLPHKERLMRRVAPVWPRAVAAAVGLLLVVGAALTLIPTKEVPATVTAEAPAVEPAAIIPAADSIPLRVTPARHRHLTPVAETVTTETVAEEEIIVAEAVEPPIEVPQTIEQQDVVPIIIETNKLAVVAPSTTITEGYTIDVQLTTTPMQTIVRNLLALKEE